MKKILALSCLILWVSILVATPTLAATSSLSEDKNQTFYLHSKSEILPFSISPLSERIDISPITIEIDFNKQSESYCGTSFEKDSETQECLFKYTGSLITPKVTGEYPSSWSHFEENLDYIISYSNNIEVGVGIVTITGIGYLKGTKAINFKIVEKLSFEIEAEQTQQAEKREKIKAAIWNSIRLIAIIALFVVLTAATVLREKRIPIFRKCESIDDNIYRKRLIIKGIIIFCFISIVAWFLLMMITEVFTGIWVMITVIIVFLTVCAFPFALWIYGIIVDKLLPPTEEANRRYRIEKDTRYIIREVEKHNQKKKK